ncbi:esterase-like activity of phytase family protein [Aquimarina litoralis]|uniref:esterase-like activity of phytase family protein n=1 Tax=Aquimarina litoralis TaxID=584605 RepID=UPI001C585D9D|nr:esterase-like activity of phytase family protein [Aquimarina litoralis]MBW1297536.1 esterase-like activity of phytase family protein [Aquimarina litoralis]
MKKTFIYSIISSFITISIISCSTISEVTTEQYEVNYLDEYVIYNDTIFPGSKIGGLSGITYHSKKDSYYFVCDDAHKPRYYEGTISLHNNKINNLKINKLTEIKDTNQLFLKNTIIDLEAIRIFEENKLIFTSEGSIKEDYNPSVFITDSLGNYLENIKLPSYFLVNKNSENTPRHNGVFEGLAPDISNSGYWISMELPLELDGKEPTFQSSGAPVRITHFDINTRKTDFQFTYPLDKLTKDPKEKFGVNGVTDLLQLSKNKFIIIERGYAAGYGTQGNTVRLYLADLKNATNTLGFDKLKNQKYQVAKKQLLFDFESVRSKLTNHIVDNIEGITLGPILSNGNQSLILIADNNFSPVSKQINQLILLELIKKN